MGAICRQKICYEISYVTIAIDWSVITDISYQKNKKKNQHEQCYECIYKFEIINCAWSKW